MLNTRILQYVSSREIKVFDSKFVTKPDVSAVPLTAIFSKNELTQYRSANVYHPTLALTR